MGETVEVARKSKGKGKKKQKKHKKEHNLIPKLRDYFINHRFNLYKINLTK